MDTSYRLYLGLGLLVIAMYALVAYSLCDPFFPWRDRPVTACDAH